VRHHCHTSSACRECMLCVVTCLQDGFKCRYANFQICNFQLSRLSCPSTCQLQNVRSTSQQDAHLRAAHLQICSTASCGVHMRVALFTEDLQIC
jgi:hypothetical protein